MIWSSLLYPNLGSVAIFCVLCAVLTYFGLNRLERNFSKDLADRISEILLVIPLALGVISGLNEIIEFRNDQKQLREAVRRAELDDSISIAFAGVSDFARQRSDQCLSGTSDATTRLMIAELNSARREVGLTQNDCTPVELGPCGPLQELARNSLIWAAAPAHAASSFSSCEVQSITNFLTNNAREFRRNGERDEITTTSDRIRRVKAHLEERQQLMDWAAAELREPGNLRFLGFWLVIFAASVELARITRKSMPTRLI